MREIEAKRGIIKVDWRFMTIIRGVDRPPGGVDSSAGGRKN